MELVGSYKVDHMIVSFLCQNVSRWTIEIYEIQYKITIEIYMLYVYNINIDYEL